MGKRNRNGRKLLLVIKTKVTDKMGTVIHITKQGLCSSVLVTIYGQSVINSGIPLVKSLFISVLTVLDNKSVLVSNKIIKLTLNRVRLIHTLKDILTKVIRTKVCPIPSIMLDKI